MVPEEDSSNTLVDAPLSLTVSGVLAALCNHDRLSASAIMLAQGSKHGTWRMIRP